MSDTKPTLKVHYRPKDGLPKQIKQRKAELADLVVGLLEHIKCRRCDGSGHLYVDVDEPCPDCVGGYLIPHLDAAAEAVARKWNSDVVLAKDRRIARAVIVAWLEEMRADK